MTYEQQQGGAGGELFAALVAASADSLAGQHLHLPTSQLGALTVLGTLEWHSVQNGGRAVADLGVTGDVIDVLDIEPNPDMTGAKRLRLLIEKGYVSTDDGVVGKVTATGRALLEPVTIT